MARRAGRRAWPAARAMRSARMPRAYARRGRRRRSVRQRDRPRAVHEHGGREKRHGRDEERHRRDILSAPRLLQNAPRGDDEHEDDDEPHGSSESAPSREKRRHRRQVEERLRRGAIGHEAAEEKAGEGECGKGDVRVSRKGGCRREERAEAADPRRNLGGGRRPTADVEDPLAGREKGGHQKERDSEEQPKAGPRL